MQGKLPLRAGVMALSAIAAALLLGLCVAGLAQKGGSKPPPPAVHDKIVFAKEVVTRWNRVSVTTQQLFSMYSDGTGLKQLTVMNLAPGYPERFCPRWLPDGRIAYVQSSPGYVFDVYVMNADGSVQRRITPASTNNMYSLSASPEGSHLAYATHVGADPSEVRVIPTAGGSPVTVFTAATAGTNVKAGNWSPDLDGDPGNGYQGMLLFGHTVDAPPYCYLKAVGVQILDGQFSVTSDPVLVLEGAQMGQWSPDGSAISVCYIGVDLGGDAAIPVPYDADGLPVFPLDPANAVLVAPGALGGTAHWSPNGTQMTYAMGADIYKIAVGSNQPTAVTRNSIWEGSPDWSPAIF